MGWRDPAFTINMTERSNTSFFLACPAIYRFAPYDYDLQVSHFFEGVVKNVSVPTYSLYDS